MTSDSSRANFRQKCWYKAHLWPPSVYRLLWSVSAGFRPARLKEKPVTSKRGSGLLTPLRESYAFMLYGRAVIISLSFPVDVAAQARFQIKRTGAFGRADHIGVLQVDHRGGGSRVDFNRFGLGRRVLQPVSIPANITQTAIF